MLLEVHNSGCLKMTLEAAGTRFIIFNIKSFPVCQKQGAIPYKAEPAIPYRAWPAIPDKHENGLWQPQNDLGSCWDQAYHFQHQKLPLYAQSSEPFHTGHGWPFRTNTQAQQTNKFHFSLLVYIYILYILYCICIYCRPLIYNNL